MAKNYAKRDGRRAAFAHATEDDAKMLNPFAAATGWNAERNRADWHAGFMAESKAMTANALDRELREGSKFDYRLTSEECGIIYDALVGAAAHDDTGEVERLQKLADLFERQTYGEVMEIV